MKRIRHRSVRSRFICQLAGCLLLLFHNPNSIFASDLGMRSENLQIHVLLSMIWTGDHLFEHNLESLSEVREEYPELSIYHFISPYYFVSSEGQKTAKDRSTKIRSHIKDQDKVGIYLEARPKLLEEARVLFRGHPMFFRDGPTSCVEMQHCQHDGILHIYKASELLNLIRTSEKLLQANSIRPDRMFMNRFWEKSRALTQVAMQLDYKMDFSAIPPSHLSHQMKYTPGFVWVQKAWQDLESKMGQPYLLTQSTGSILMIPQSAGVIDFSTPQRILQRFENHLQELKANDRRDYVFHLVFHQETIDIFKPRLKKVLKGLFETAKKEGAVLTYQLSAAPLPQR